MTVLTPTGVRPSTVRDQEQRDPEAGALFVAVPGVLPEPASIVGRVRARDMVDPVSSLAYAIEAALGALKDRGGSLGLLLPTMGLVMLVIAVIVLNYRQLVSRFLVAAGASAFQAGPGLLRALAREEPGKEARGILPSWLGQTNRYYTPFWGVAVYMVLTSLVVVVAGAGEQSLVSSTRSRSF